MLAEECLGNEIDFDFPVQIFSFFSYELTPPTTAPITAPETPPHTAPISADRSMFPPESNALPPPKRAPADIPDNNPDSAPPAIPPIPKEMPAVAAPTPPAIAPIPKYPRN